MSRFTLSILFFSVLDMAEIEKEDENFIKEFLESSSEIKNKEWFEIEELDILRIVEEHKEKNARPIRFDTIFKMFDEFLESKNEKSDDEDEKYIWILSKKTLGGKIKALVNEKSSSKLSIEDMQNKKKGTNSLFCTENQRDAIIKKRQIQGLNQRHSSTKGKSKKKGFTKKKKKKYQDKLISQRRDRLPVKLSQPDKNYSLDCKRHRCFCNLELDLLVKIVLFGAKIFCICLMKQKYCSG